MPNGNYFTHHCKSCGKQTGSIDAKVTICYQCKVDARREAIEAEEQAAQEHAQWAKEYKQFKKEQKLLKKRAI